MINKIFFPIRTLNFTFKFLVLIFPMFGCCYEQWWARKLSDLKKVGFQSSKKSLWNKSQLKLNFSKWIMNQIALDLKFWRKEDFKITSGHSRSDIDKILSTSDLRKLLGFFNRLRTRKFRMIASCFWITKWYYKSDDLQTIRYYYLILQIRYCYFSSKNFDV